MSLRWKANHLMSFDTKKYVFRKNILNKLDGEYIRGNI